MDVVQAYASVAVFFDPHLITLAEATAELAKLDTSLDELVEGKHHRILVCYELGLDWPLVAKHTGLGVDRLIGLHTAQAYVVYAIGFCPGFPYLGYLPQELQGVPRLTSPRLSVDAGSVGLTGKQTGIYTEARPGGWNIIGRTPLELVNVADNYFPLRTGDMVQFWRIDEAEYARLKGERL